ncbi:DEAD-domain-containing protein [Auriscalpium vulgare]|uniref:DEAD-domain-containing protein n=1 Tax=Auriscalpium vulgare TaxID=40419 RepID=A0ACB8RGZ5_9AGAM|nr:DEAD-domain-containing protein [Auriscalpium vulgare]
MALELDDPVPAPDKSLKRKKSKSTLPQEQVEKKSKKKDKAKADPPVDAGDDELDARERKRARKEEKERKRKEKQDAAPVDSEQTVQTAADTAEASSNVEKKKKKHKDKSKRVEESAPDADEPKSEKKKKRKHDADVAEAEASSSKSATKEHKSKKQRPSSFSTPLSSTPAAPTLAPPSPSPEAYFAEHSISITVAKGGEPVLPVLSFGALPVPDSLRAAFTGFSTPTPIQACTWLPALAGRDVVGIAETGSGKTLAFGIPALARLLAPSAAAPKAKSKAKKAQQVSVLVMAPTRELALQTHETLAGLTDLSCIAVYGGVSKEPQVRSLKGGARIVVGTPGRILDLVRDGACDLSAVEYLVLDEADRMLDKGFENDIRAIIGYTRQGEERQTLMFSATWPDAVRRLAASFQRDPVRVTVGSDDLTANSRVEQSVEVFDDDREKDQRLLKHLHALAPKKNNVSDPEAARILVFVLYKKEAARVEGMLKRSGYSVGGLHGDLSQDARTAALGAFKDGTTRLLVATDVAARGLDIPSVACVINYSFPLTIEDYIHRIGRTGRGGRSGKSITFFTGDKHERALAGELARVLRDSGFDTEGLQKFPMTIKKKTHAVYGAFFRDDVDMTAVPKKIVFDD